MRQLEVVAVSDDGTSVLLASAEDATRATHSIRIDNRLHAAIRGELDDSERRESELSPKEIQARLRSGESTEQVAKAAKVPVARVMRYAGPVLSERERIIDQARAAPVAPARGHEPVSTPLGEIAEKRLAVAVGLRPETVIWSARRRDDGAWVVALDYTAKGGARSAEWLWQPVERELASDNALATRFSAEDAGAVRRRGPASSRASAKSSPARAQPAAKASRKAAAKAPARAAAKPATAKKAANPSPKAAKPTARRPGKASVAQRATRQPSAAPKPVRKSAKAAASHVAPRPAKVAARRRAAAPAEPPVVEIAAKRSNGRVAVPSWSDVLLGVQAPPVTRGRRRT